MSAPLLRWHRVPGALTTELVAPSAIVGRTYTIAKYDGNPRRYGQWRLTASDDDDTLHWAMTLRDAKAIADTYDRQRVADAARTGGRS